MFLHIWSKKEIENFFIIPTAIRRLISRSAGRRTVLPTEEEVAAQIRILADDMEDVTFDALSFECLCIDRAGGISQANRKARNKIREIRNDTDSIVDIVAGKELISKLSEWSQTEFGIAFSPLALLRELNSTEIHDELQRVVGAIERTYPFVSAQ